MQIGHDCLVKSLGLAGVLCSVPCDVIKSRKNALFPLFLSNHEIRRIEIDMASTFPCPREYPQSPLTQIISRENLRAIARDL